MKLKPNILKLVEDYQYRKAICYAKTNERIYINLRRFYIVGFIYQSFIILFLALGNAFMPHYLEGAKIFAPSIISFVFFTVAFILALFKWDCISLPLNIVGTVFLVPLMKPVLFLTTGHFYIKGTFYVKHLIPLVLILIPSIWMCIISTRERYFIHRDYKVVMDKLYKQHHTEEMTDDEWEEFVDNYNEASTNVKTIK